MSALTAEREEVKTLLRGILISSPTSMTADQLQRDYRNLEGRDVPYRKLGFSSFQQFLLSVPDTVILRTTSKGGSPIVVPVQSAKSSHVDALVQKQKVSVPKRLMKRASFLTRRTSVKAHPESHRNRSYSADSTQRIFIPHHLQQRINEFLRDNPQGVRIQVFEKEFFSAQTLQNYGVRSGEIQQLLAHLSHILKVSGGMVYPLLEKQSVYRPVTYFPNEDKNPKNFIPSGCENNFVSVEQNGFLEGDIKLTEEDDDDIVAELYEHIGKSNNVLWEINETTSQVTSFVNKEKECGIQSSERSQSEISPPSCAYSNDLVSHQMRRQFMLLLDKNPDGIWCSELPQLYKEEFGVTLEYQNMGFISVLQMASNILDVFHCVKPDGTDWKVFDARKPLPSQYVSCDIKNHKSVPVETTMVPRVPSKVKYNIDKLLMAYPSGLPSDEFVNLYEANELILDLYPPEVIGHKEKLQYQKIPPETTNGSLLEVLVAEVYTPQNFWIQLRGEKTHLALDKLMNDIQDFYDQEEKSYHMPDSTVKIGQYCMAPYNEEWHRVCITTVHNLIEVQVLFVDYGTTSRVKKKDLRFMHQDFGAFPMQAIQASLANLIPAGDGKKWPRAVNKRFLEMVSEKTLIAVVSSVDHETKQGRLCSMKPLVAIVLAVDFKARKVEVALVDTSGPEDIHINDVLEREGLAQFMTSRQPQPQPPSPPVQRTGVDLTLPTVTVTRPPPGFTSDTSVTNKQPLPAEGPSASMQKAADFRDVQSPTFPQLQTPHSNINQPNYLVPQTPCVNPVQMFPSSYFPQTVPVQQPMSFSEQLLQQQILQTIMFNNPALAMLVSSQMAANHIKAVAAMNTALAFPVLNPPVMFNPAPINPRTTVTERAANLGQSEVDISEISTALRKDSASQYQPNQPVVSEPCTPEPIVNHPASPEETMTRSSIQNRTATTNTWESPTFFTKPKSDKVDQVTQHMSQLSAGVQTTKDSTLLRKEVETIKTVENSPLVPRTLLRKEMETIKTVENSPLIPPSISVKPDCDKSDQKTQHMSEFSSSFEASFNLSLTKDLKTVNPVPSNDSMESASSYSEIINNVFEDAQKGAESIVQDGPCDELNLGYTSGSDDIYRSDDSEEISDTPPPKVKQEPHYVKKIEMANKIIHLINFSNRAYLSVDEIVRAFTDFSGRHVILKILDAKGIRLPFSEIERRKESTIFEALDGCNIIGLPRNANGYIVGNVSLIPLQSVIQLLSLLSVRNKSLFQALQEEIEKFNPLDEYWTGN
ncbi:tudor domain-containing protein 5-like isoform X4 [Periplaneta americana]|uniref:tudor domain-containing protein 5-like isoform X4 n=1 Tax=Periplaneta americana TaxID=6978 RepID=UPI0037E936EA